MGLRILKPGLLATIQDAGRWGYQSEGLPVAGAMDLYSMRLANILCGNPPETATIEISWHGFQCLTETPMLLACAGHGARLFIHDVPQLMGRPILVPAFSLLRFEPSDRGFYSYLAIAGGFDLPKVKGSVSTYLPGRLGGWLGRALEPGDLLPASSLRSPVSDAIAQSLRWSGSPSPVAASWSVDLRDTLPGEIFRIMEGPEYDWFSDTRQALLYSQSYQLSPQSNRMASRLQSLPILLDRPRELLSTAVTRGTVQVTHEGSLILLMADAQTMGGYPRIAQMARVDTDRFAQCRPGDRVRFTCISPREAEALYLTRENDLRQVQQSIRLRLES